MDQTILRYRSEQDELKNKWLLKGDEYFVAMLNNNARMASDIRDDMNILLKRAQALELAMKKHK